MVVSPGGWGMTVLGLTTDIVHRLGMTLHAEFGRTYSSPKNQFESKDIKT